MEYNIFDLPEDMFIEIFTYLKDYDFIQFIKCSKQTYKYIKYKSIQKIMDIEDALKMKQYKFKNIKYGNGNDNILNYQTSEYLKTEYLDILRPEKIIINKIKHKSLSFIPQHVKIINLNNCYHDSKINTIHNKVETFIFGHDILLSYFDEDEYNNVNFIGENIKIYNVSLNKFIYLKNLKIGNLYDSSLELLKLPLSIEKLIIGNMFNQSINELSKLKKLKVLKLGHSFNYSINELPNTVEVLSLGIRFNNNIYKWPLSLKKINILCDIDINILPITLTYLSCVSNNYNINFSHLINLKTLKLTNTFNSNITSFPKSLTLLEFGNDFNKLCDFKIFPKSLTKLKFGYNFNKSLNNISMLSNLKELTFIGMFNKPLNNLPTSLIKLNILSKYHRNIKEISHLTNLKKLKYDSCSSYKIKDLPNSIILLHFGKSFKARIINFPSSLIKIKCELYSNVSLINMNSYELKND